MSNMPARIKKKQLHTVLHVQLDILHSIYVNVNFKYTNRRSGCSFAYHC